MDVGFGLKRRPEGDEMIRGHTINYKELGRSNHWFHRAWFSYNSCARLEVWTGLAFRFEFYRGDASDDSNSCQIILGLLFITFSFTFPCPEMFLKTRKVTSYSDPSKEVEVVDGREYGFYFFHWAFFWKFHASNQGFSSSDPKWMRWCLDIKDFFLGKTLIVMNRDLEINNIQFKLGDKTFTIDSVKFEHKNWFRSRIPFCLHKWGGWFMGLSIDKPPLLAGKGENSWDCGDDGCFGLHCAWEGSEPSWSNKEELAREAAAKYISGVLGDVNKYGTSKDPESGFNLEDKYEYVGIKKVECKLLAGRDEMTKKQGEQNECSYN